MNALALLLLAHANTDTSVQTRLLTMVNGYREAHGLEQLSLHEPLCRVAEGHAGFMFTNRVLTHEESPEKKGFTGSNLAARAATIGWKDECSELVGFATTGMTDSVQAIFDSPCHRVRFLKPGKLSLGAAARGDFVCLLVGGEAEKAVVVSPPDGATQVPTKWFGATDYSGTRTGPGSRLYGYPIVFIDTDSGNQPFQTLTADLNDANGNAVDVIVRNPENDPHFRTAVTLIPLKPLETNTCYHVHVNVKLSDGQTEESSWSFTTRI